MRVRLSRDAQADLTAIPGRAAQGGPMEELLANLRNVIASGLAVA